jgi:hypothetical protein
VASELRRREAWRTSGAASPVDWLAATANLPRGQAHAELSLRDALDQSGRLADGVASGEVGIGQAQAVAGLVGRDDFATAVDDLVGEVAGQSPVEARRTVGQWKGRHDPAGHQRDAEALFAQRSLRLGCRGDGMGTGEWLLDPEAQAIVRAAVDHIARQDRLDGTLRTRPQRLADALVALCGAYNAGQVTGGREVPTVLVKVDYDTVMGLADHPGVTASGETLTGEAVRRLCCDAGLHRLVTRGRSCVLDLGASTRVISDAQFLALVERDGQCRFPGCARPPAWCQGHHIIPWPIKQRTDLDDVVLLCHYHHHLVHDSGWRLAGTPDHLRVIRPDGTPHHPDPADPGTASGSGAPAGAGPPGSRPSGPPGSNPGSPAGPPGPGTSGPPGDTAPSPSRPDATATLFDRIAGGPFPDPPGDPPRPPV